MVAVTLIPLIPALRRTWPSADKFSRDPDIGGSAFVRMHCTVIALVILQIIFHDAPGRHVFLLSAGVLTINYFPWRVLKEQ